MKNSLELLFESSFATYNGPYNEKDCKIRHLAHELVYQSLARKEKNELRITQILSEISDDFNEGYNWKFRESEIKDSANGLMGLAWLIEGINAAYFVGIYNSMLNSKVAEVLGLLNWEGGIWTNIPTQKEVLDITDYTRNHQLWLIINSGVAAKMGWLEPHFYSKAIEHLNINLDSPNMVNGFVQHHMNLPFKSRLAHVIRMLDREKRNDYLQKIRGYHFFNIQALSIAIFYDFEKDLCEKLATKWMKKLKNYEACLDVSNKYGWTYNPVYIELQVFKTLILKEGPPALSLQGLIDHHLKGCLSSQISYDKDMSLLRTYEICYAIV